MLYTALGNCLAAGAGGLLLTTGYPVHVRNMLAVALREPVELRNYGNIWGMFCWELLDRLQHDTRMRRDLAHSEIVTFKMVASVYNRPDPDSPIGWPSPSRRSAKAFSLGAHEKNQRGYRTILADFSFNRIGINILKR